MDFKVPSPTTEAVFMTASQAVDWGIIKNKIPEIWTRSKGEGVKIALLDAGWPFHTDLINNILEVKDFVGPDSIEKDIQNHSVSCAGIMVANDNAFGIVGVAPKAVIIYGRVLKSNGSGSAINIINGVDYAIRCKVDILSLSFGARFIHDALYEKIKEAYNKGIVIVSSAGNDKVEDSINYPAKWEEVISVGAVDDKDVVADFCSKGYKIDVYAPGVSILSTHLNNSYGCFSGTSFAAPFVSGIIALGISLRRKNNKKDLSPAQIRKVLNGYALSSFVEEMNKIV